MKYRMIWLGNKLHTTLFLTNKFGKFISLKSKCSWYFCILTSTSFNHVNYDAYSLTWCSSVMGELSCLGGSRLPRGYQGTHDSMTAGWVGDMRILQRCRMTRDQILMDREQSTDHPGREAQWGDGRRSTPSWWGLLWHPVHMSRWVCLREDRLHEVPADRDQALTCHALLAR